MENIKELLLKLISFDTQNNDEVGANSLKGETIELLKFVKEDLEKLKINVR